jgi:hypothetical protein
LISLFGIVIDGPSVVPLVVVGVPTFGFFG